MVDVKNLWDWDFLWNTFAFLMKIASPFVMIAVAVLVVGGLLIMIVLAVVTALRNK